MKRNIILILLMGVLTTSCAAPNNIAQDIHKNTPVEISQERIENAPGFWIGLWHGSVAPFAFVGHLFNQNIAVYNVINTGGWYDFGFLLGVGAFSLGSSTTSNRK